MNWSLMTGRAGLDRNTLSEEQCFILGGKIRHEPVPQDREIYCRQFVILHETKRLAT
jgi:hypothetical protein